MSYRSSVFKQLLQYIPRLEFKKIVLAHQGDKGVRKLSTWSQFVGLLFGQLTGHNSLRAICTGLKAARAKLYHLGISFEIRRSTLAEANDKRSPDIMKETFFRLLPQVQRVAPRAKLKLKGQMLALDSTTIELCLALSPWARFHHGKGACKLHIAIDIAGDLPNVVVLTSGKMSDIRVARGMRFDPGTMLMMDRGYVDSEWLWNLTQKGVWFVTRLKKNMKYKVRQSNGKKNNIKADQIIKLTGPGGRAYEGKLRRISYRDEQTGHRYEFLTNRFDLAAQTICDLYKARWQVELFFKTMKQHLQVKKFVGTSVNAVLMQVWVALVAYLLLMLIKYQARLGWSLPALMAALTVSLFENRELISLWEDVPKKRRSVVALNQLHIPFI